MKIPELINNIAELEDFMTTPSDAVVEAMRKMTGDLLILGVGGKIGPSLAILAKRAAGQAGVKKRIIGVSLFPDLSVRDSLTRAGVETIACDLLEENALAQLPDIENVIYMVGMKFGATGREAETWAVNTYLPGRVAQKFRNSKIVLFSTGNVYPLTPLKFGGCKETDPVAPIGEYAQSALGRERIFEYFSGTQQIKGVIIRLNYAIDLRYGILLDVAQKVFQKQPIDLTMGHVNVIWQGDENAIALRSLELARTPPFVLNVTGPETISIRKLAQQFGELFQVAPILEDEEAETALLSDASQCHRLFGYPQVTLEQMIRWVAHWVKISGPTLAKPTHYEVRTGKF
ncbi:MAG: NAD-dependent epimerase/dehydratase family protein [candidate division KSB1 bacterium]|nr:NAD-dependent epimerase/dehydratase family protein [candidate division KSB1 bacterium]MDZ7301320.1 NAD-dependent epimerase/dehydratase family protein [candidate division KSB1 bacterium]MDZ7310795.1 NAD-dependent epimerase/dehydratase family protein [candidate division KSB1 bacterium]